MIILDWWTIVHVVLFTCGLISYIIAYKREKNKDEEDDDDNDDEQSD